MVQRLSRELLVSATPHPAPPSPSAQEHHGPKSRVLRAACACQWSMPLTGACVGGRSLGFQRGRSLYRALSHGKTTRIALQATPGEQQSSIPNNRVASVSAASAPGLGRHTKNLLGRCSPHRRRTPHQRARLGRRRPSCARATHAQGRKMRLCAKY